MKNAPYFIIGLPRSRTAWLANLLTYGNSYCWHEASRYVAGMAMLPAFMNRRRAKYRGNSDSGLCGNPYLILNLFPTSKFVFIHRPVRACIKSAVEQFPEIPPCVTDKSIQACQQGFIDLNCGVKPGQKINFEYDQLNNLETLREIWRFCIPGVKFDRERAEMLQQMRVDTVFAKMEAAMHPVYQERIKNIRRFQSVLP